MSDKSFLNDLLPDDCQLLRIHCHRCALTTLHIALICAVRYKYYGYPKMRDYMVKPLHQAS